MPWYAQLVFGILALCSPFLGYFAYKELVRAKEGPSLEDKLRQYEDLERVQRDKDHMERLYEWDKELHPDRYVAPPQGGMVQGPMQQLLRAGLRHAMGRTGVNEVYPGKIFQEHSPRDIQAVHGAWLESTEFSKKLTYEYDPATDSYVNGDGERLTLEQVHDLRYPKDNTN